MTGPSRPSNSPAPGGFVFSVSDSSLQSSPLRVLEVSDDPSLASSRLLVLQSAGFRVDVLTTLQVRDIVQSGSGSRLAGYDIYLICQSLAPRLAAEMASLLRAQVSQPRILRIRHRQPDTIHVANLYLTAPVAPPDLIQSVTMLHSAFPRSVAS
jgi:DNA-binding response OmpR family regulator